MQRLALKLKVGVSVCRKRTWLYVLCIVLATQLLQVPIFAQHPKYRFSPIATSQDPQFSFFPDQTPQITEDGRVLFFVRLENDDGAYLFGDEDSLETVLEWNSSFGSLLGTRHVNCSGDVVFIEDLGPTVDHLYHWSSDQGLRVLYSGTGSVQTAFMFSPNDQPAINSHGQVAFIAGGQGMGGESVFLGDLQGDLPAPVIASAFDGFSQFFHIFLSDSGSIIVNGTKNGVRGIYELTAPGESQLIAGVGKKFESIFDFDANNQGQVLFTAVVDGNSALYLGDQNGVELVDQDDDAHDLFSSRGINDHGDLVYTVGVFGDPQGGRTVQIGPDLVADRLIGAGDLLLGNSVLTAWSGEGSINNRGQIAFSATWFDSMTEDFEHGIFVATPVLFGDVNLDDAIDLLDIAPFVELLDSLQYQLEADINCDGVVSLVDVAPFVDLLNHN